MAIVIGAAGGGVASGQVPMEWQQAQSRIHSVTFHWTETHVVARGTVRNLAQPVPVNPQRLVSPEADASYKLSSSLTFSRGKFRFEEKGWLPAWVNRQGMRSYRHYISVYDGQQNRTLEGSESWREFPFGTVYDQSVRSFLDLSRASLLPIRTHYLVMDPSAVGFDATRLRVVAPSVVINGQPCLLMENVAGRTIHRIYVDEARSHVIVRLEKLLDGQLRSQADFTHDLDATHGWVLNGWKWMRHRNGRLETSIAGRVTRYAINPELGPSTFDLPFPHDTFVEDFSIGRDYIQRPEGERRYILPVEAHAPYSRLVRTEPGDAVDRGPDLTLPLRILAGALVALLAAIVYWRLGNK